MTGAALLGLLVRRVLAALLAELGELKTRLERPLVLGGMVIQIPALRALELDEIFLGHSWLLIVTAPSEARPVRRSP